MNFRLYLGMSWTKLGYTGLPPGEIPRDGGRIIAYKDQPFNVP